MNPDFPPHEPLLAFAERLADRSRAMLLKAAAQTPEIEIKPDASYVTATDKAIEKALREMIVKTYPDHGILGEEMENINLEAEFVWVLDPIDGTAAFVGGIPVYGTLIGLAWKGKPFIGVIDHPMTSDRWTGVSGLFAKHNGKSVKVRACPALANAYATCSNPDFMSTPERARFDIVRERVAYVQYGGSCYAYGILASGRSDIAIDSGLEAFDVYASAAVIRGAGGEMCDWNGEDVSFGMKGTVVCAGDPARLKELLAILKDKLP